MKEARKKPGAGAPKGLKVVSAYKSREADDKIHRNDAAFRKAFNKRKDASDKV